MSKIFQLAYNMHNCIRTGTVKASSFIVAINGESLAGKTILQVEEMLENCGNAVTLTIKKSIKQSSMLYSFYWPLIVTNVTEPRSKQASPVGRVSISEDASCLLVP